VTVDNFEKLLTLINGIVLGEEDLHIESQADRSLLGGGSLLTLVVVFVGDERHHKPELFHLFPARFSKS
jgi:hypothetical protein